MKVKSSEAERAGDQKTICPLSTNNEQRPTCNEAIGHWTTMLSNYKVQRSETIGHAKNECDFELKRE